MARRQIVTCLAVLVITCYLLNIRSTDGATVKDNVEKIIEKKVRKDLDDIIKGLNRGVVAAFARWYCEHAVLFPNNQAQINGSEAIEQFYEGLHEKVKSVTITNIQMNVLSRKYVYQTNDNELLDKDGNLVAKGRAMLIWKRTNETNHEWVIAREMTNARP